MNPSKILLLVTGGTLDKDYAPHSGELTFSETHLPELLEQANITLDLEITTLLLKDSLEMTPGDRQLIANACANTSANKIVITHGTDTLTETANFLSEHTDLADKTIVITGAMRPFRLGRSDAAFNVGTAIMAASLSSSGVFITMNGRCFPAGTVSKNRVLGVFESYESLK